MRVSRFCRKQISSMSYRRVFFRQEIYFYVHTSVCTIRVYTVVYNFFINRIKSRTHNIYILYNIYGITPIFSKGLNLDSIPRYGRVYTAVPGETTAVSAADTGVYLEYYRVHSSTNYYPDSSKFMAFYFKKTKFSTMYCILG